MKKGILRTLSLTLALVFILSITLVSVNALSMDCLTEHFNRLNYRAFNPKDEDEEAEDEEAEDKVELIPTPPSQNSCPYVAMSMLLAYYDSYWNERFVPDELEWENGVYDSANDDLLQTFAAIEEARDWDDYVTDLNLSEETETWPSYRPYVWQHFSDYLEPHLIGIGISLFYHTDPNGTFGLATNNAVEVLEEYLYDRCDFTPLDVTIHTMYESEGDIVAKMKEIINKGFPVYYVGYQEVVEEGETTLLGHVMIAYKIHANGNIGLHTGWSMDPHRTYIVPGNTAEGIDNVNEYTLNRSIMWLEIDETFLPHIHAYNYVDSVNGEPLCSCQIYGTHPAHEDNHKHFTRTYSNDTRKECACGYSEVIHVHEKNYEITGSENHYEECTTCNYSSISEHKYNLEYVSQQYHIHKCECGMMKNLDTHYAIQHVNINNSSFHEAVCECGYTWNTPHFPVEYKNKNNMSHYIVCECGYTIGTASHTLVSMGGTRYRCVDCGALFNSSSDIIIKKDDPEYESQ